jgi:hypothetical protein
MRFTKQVLEIARSAVQKHSNVKKATDVAERDSAGWSFLELMFG